MKKRLAVKLSSSSFLISSLVWVRSYPVLLLSLLKNPFAVLLAGRLTGMAAAAPQWIEISSQELCDGQSLGLKCVCWLYEISRQSCSIKASLALWFICELIGQCDLNPWFEAERILHTTRKHFFSNSPVIDRDVIIEDAYNCCIDDTRFLLKLFKDSLACLVNWMNRFQDNTGWYLIKKTDRVLQNQGFTAA